VSGAWLVLPTYNEAENLEAMIRAVLPRLAEASPEHHVIVVDDGSPDGTGLIADRLAAELEPVEVIHRAFKAGIGPAYLDGFAHALAAGADYLLEMDSDFSHDPADLPRLIRAAAAADLVIGSRYVAGGGVENWGLARRAVSRGGCLYARAILRVPIRDLTGGFKCFRREVLTTLDLSRVAADGYGFQIEMNYRTLKAGFRVREEPIVFRERRAGQSKMSAKIAVEALWKVPALRVRGRGGRAPALQAETG
jgi:dolichol-phosphate mannosyltransferase